MTNLADIEGIGSSYADKPEAAGVDTVSELAQRKSENLLVKLTQVNEEKKLVRRVPAEEQVAAWVAEAQKLPRVVTY